MSKSLRLSEKWFRRGLWLVAFIFASFLIGLGGTIVGDLPQVESHVTLERFMDQGRADAARGTIKAAQQSEQQAQDALAQARLKLQVAQADVANARKSFENWIATRSATERAEQDPEVVSRTQALDTLQARERAARADVEKQQQAQLDAQQASERAQRDLQQLQEKLTSELQTENQKNSLQLRDSINSFLKIYNKDKGYSLIISNTQLDNLLFADKSLDITQEIVDGLNARYNPSTKK